MKKIILLAGLILISHHRIFAQKDTLKVNKVWRTGINYKSYVIADNQLFALNDSGKLIIWDLNKLDTVHFVHNTCSINYTAIAKDRFNNIFLGTKKGEIFKLTSNRLASSLYLKTKYPIRYMCFNSSNNLFLIVPNAVYDPLTKQHWNKFENHTTALIATQKSFIFFHKKATKYFSMPQYSFLDNEDRLWMTASYGEFGGDIQVFDTKNKTIANNKFENLNPSLLSPRSVFEDSLGNIYITSGLQHFMNSGEIYRIRKGRNAAPIFDTNKDFIGPGAYCKNDNYIYFATTSGFYKADLANGYLTPEFLFNTNFSWSREPLAIGVAMNIIKLDFTKDSKLLFLTKNDGFGIYDGKQLVMLK